MSETMSENEEVDLATMSYDNIRDLARSKKVLQEGQSKLSRQELVAILRTNRIGTNASSALVSCASCISLHDSLANFTKALEGMVMKMAGFMEMKSTIEHIQQEIATMKNEGQQEGAKTQSTANVRNHQYATVAQSAPAPACEPKPYSHKHVQHQSMQTATDTQLTKQTDKPARMSTGSTEDSNSSWQTQGPRRPNRRRASGGSSSHPGTSATGSTELHVRSSVTSKYVKEVTVTAAPGVLSGVERKRLAVLHVGNVEVGCEAQSIVRYCADRNIDIIRCSIATNCYFGTAYAKVTIPADVINTVLTPAFWPATIGHTVRK